MEHEQLGKLVEDHRGTHERVAEQEAKLEQTGDNLILLGNNLKKNPLNIRIGQAKTTLKDDRNEDKNVLLSALNISDIFHAVEELRQETDRKQQLEQQLKENGMGYIVDGLDNRKPSYPDIIREHR